MAVGKKEQVDRIYETKAAPQLSLREVTSGGTLIISTTFLAPAQTTGACII